MAAGSYDFTIEQGATLSKTMTFYTDATKTDTVDLSAADMNMQIRKVKSSVDFIDELTSDNSRIDKSDAANGVIILLFSATITAAYDFEEAYYDLEFTSATVVSRVLEGVITLNKEVTK